MIYARMDHGRVHVHVYKKQHTHTHTHAGALERAMHKIIVNIRVEMWNNRRHTTAQNQMQLVFLILNLIKFSVDKNNKNAKGKHDY